MRFVSLSTADVSGGILSLKWDPRDARFTWPGRHREASRDSQTLHDREPSDQSDSRGADSGNAMKRTWTIIGVRNVFSSFK